MPPGWLCKLCLLYFVLFLAFGVFLPFVSVWLRWQGLTTASIGIVIAISKALTSVANPVAGLLADKLRAPKHILVVSLLLSTACAVAATLMAPWTDANNSWNTKKSVGILLFFGFVLCRSPVASLLDSVTLEELTEHGRDKATYGRVRLWGAVSWGLASFGSGWVVDYFGYRVLMLPLVVATLAFVVGIVGTGTPVVSLWKRWRTPSQDSQWSAALISAPASVRVMPSSQVQDRGLDEDVGDGVVAMAEERPLHDDSRATLSTDRFSERALTLVRNPQMMLFLTISVFGGAASTIVNTYLLIFLQEYLDASNLLLGLSVTATVLVEIPLFFVSNRLLKLIGVRGLVVASHLAYIVRVLVYSVLGNAWLVLPVELFHGLTFAAFWAAGVEQMHRSAPVGLGATAQGLFAAAYGGVGSGIGALVGGWLFQSYGPRTLWWSVAGFMTVSLALFAVLFRPIDRVPIDVVEEEIGLVSELPSDQELLEVENDFE